MKVKNIILNTITFVSFLHINSCNMHEKFQSKGVKPYQILLMPFTIPFFLYKSCNSAFCEINEEEDLICKNHLNSNFARFCCQREDIEKNFNQSSDYYRSEFFVSNAAFSNDMQNAVDYYKAFYCFCYSFNCYKQCSCKRSPHCNSLKSFIEMIPISDFKEEYSYDQFNKLHKACIEEIIKKSNEQNVVSIPVYITHNLLRIDIIMVLNEYEIDATIFFDTNRDVIVSTDYKQEIRSNSRNKIKRLELGSPT